MMKRSVKHSSRCICLYPQPSDLIFYFKSRANAVILYGLGFQIISTAYSIGSNMTFFLYSLLLLLLFGEDLNESLCPGRKTGSVRWG